MSKHVLEKPSLILRIGIGKLVGLGFGILGFFLLPAFFPQAHDSLKWGILLWYPTVGAFVGIFGIYVRHPVVAMPLPWWLRSCLIGAWMNFVLVLFVHEQFEVVLSILSATHVAWLSSPVWFVIEGGFIGLIMGWFATKFGGEGRPTIEGQV